VIKLKNILNEKLSVTGGPARQIVNSILPSNLFAKGDIESQKKHKQMIDDLVKTLNKFYQKYNIDKEINL